MERFCYKITEVCVLWQSDTPQYSLCIMAVWYTSIQSVYYGRLIHLNTVCVSWQTDTHQYSLCIMAHWYSPIHRTLLFSSNSSLLSIQCSFDKPIHVTFTFTIYTCWSATLSAACCLPMESRALLQWAFYITSLSYSCWTSLGISW